jgi:hypothetical protein
MPTSVTHGTLSDGRLLEINATEDGRLEVDAELSSSSADSFGRLKVAQPLTLFDSSHRFSDNGLWNTLTTNGGAANFNADQGLVDLTVTSSSGSKVIRETKKVFAYQPGKSLLPLNTFVLSPAKTNLRQRCGYFGSENGAYIELSGSQVSFVLRSKASGGIVDTPVVQSSWNGTDKLDGTGPSGITLDLSKAQIFWTDFEWLGVGTVRCGFVINGEFVHCHSFHHANLITSTYMTTACLPLRYEIENLGATASSSTMKQICSTVISEGGYEIRGRHGSVGTAINIPYSMATAGTYYPIVALRLKSTKLDSITIPTAASVVGTGNNLIYKWRVVTDSTVTGGSWDTIDANSSVEYNIGGTSITGGNITSSGYFVSSNQSTPIADIIRQSLFSLQLERNTFTSTPFVFAIAMSCNTNTTNAYGSIDWEEVTR